MRKQKMITQIATVALIAPPFSSSITFATSGYLYPMATTKKIKSTTKKKMRGLLDDLSGLV